MIKEVAKNNLRILMDVETEYEAHRFDTFFRKEPETITWIENFVKEDDVFFDVGANVGVFSLYAAALSGRAKIYAFEPAYHNFAKLCKNIAANNFKNCLPYSLALGKDTKADMIFLASNISGSARHIFPGAPEYLSKDFNPEFRQGVLAVKLDDLVFKYGLPLPKHIKIDTDGFEEDVLDGARNTLESGAVKSLLVEINDIQGLRRRIMEKMKNLGFSAECPINQQEEHSRARRKASGNGYVENVIFTLTMNAAN